MVRQRPLLLVSVRNAIEANKALCGGCDILDVKDPSRGPLGMADVDAINEVLAVSTGAVRSIPVSAALGELTEWLGRTPPYLPDGLRWAKLGPAETETLGRWRRCWREVCSRFEQTACRQLRWVGVAYADASLAASPPAEQLIDAILSESCEVVLIDTFCKSAGRLLDWITVERLTGICERVHAAGRYLAVAGRLTTELLPAVCECGADVVAVRGAACERGRRDSSISEQAVRRLSKSLLQLGQAPVQAKA